MSKELTQCPRCKGSGYTEKSEPSHAAFTSDELIGIGIFFGVLGFFGALAFGGSWSMGFFVGMLSFLAGVSISLEADRRLGL